MHPFFVLLAVFIAVPLLEIWLLIEVGGLIGAGWTVLLVVLTAVAGASLVRVQGFSTVQRIRLMLAQGQMPALEMLEGLSLFLAGALLLTPGFFTDSVGFILLIPPLRRVLLLSLLRRGIVGTVHGQAAPGAPRGHGTQGQRHTLEGEWRREQDD